MDVLDSDTHASLARDARSLEPLLAAAGANIAEFGRCFYARLFALAPAARSLFPEQMAAQEDKLSRTLVTALGLFEDPKTLSRELRRLGARHVLYGAAPLHYMLVGQALTEALGTLAGDRFGPPERAAWQRVYGYIAAEMLMGAGGLDEGTLKEGTRAPQ